MMSGTRTVSEFTSQLFFDGKVTYTVHLRQPYAQMGKRTLLNAGNSIYRNGGSQLLLSLSKSGTALGYAATFDIGMNFIS